jgi:hypothetical protein
MIDHILNPIHSKGNGMTPRVLSPTARHGTKNDYAGEDQQQFTAPERPTHSNPEDGDSTLLQNIGIHLQYYYWCHIPGQQYWQLIKVVPVLN